MNRMNLDLYEILPEEIPDEEADRLTTFFMDLALAIESHYYGQVRAHNRHIESHRQEAWLERLNRENNADTAEVEELDF